MVEYGSLGGYQNVGAWVHALNEDYENFKGAIYKCKDKQLSETACRGGVLGMIGAMGDVFHRGSRI